MPRVTWPPKIVHIDPYFYLCTPFRRYPWGMAAAERMARQQATFFLQAGIPMFSPIAYGAPIAIESGIPNGVYAETDEQKNFWLEFDKIMLLNAKGIVVVRAESWEESEGIKKEIAWASRVRAIYYCDPDDQSETIIKLLADYPTKTRGSRMNQPPTSVLRKRRKVALEASRDYRNGYIDKEVWRSAIILGQYEGTKA